MRVVKVPSGRTVNLWYGFNRKGKLHYLIRSRGGENIAKLWWVLWGCGTTDELGELADAGSVEIPISRDKAVIAAGLCATADDDTIIYLEENDALDEDLPFRW
jgi:hypothetical protein